MVDETPLGAFLEIEGPPETIDEAARALGLHPGDYVLDSYPALFRAAGGRGRHGLLKARRALKAMILAAGLGTRMRPLTRLRAKPALPVLDRPLLHWTLDALADAGVREVAINTHHLPATVRDAVGTGERWGMRVTWSHERRVLGTGGGPRRLRRFFGDAPCLLVNGDVFFRFPLRALFERQRRTGAASGAGAHPEPRPGPLQRRGHGRPGTHPGDRGPAPRRARPAVAVHRHPSHRPRAPRSPARGTVRLRARPVPAAPG